jgi:hypothetical protein
MRRGEQCAGEGTDELPTLHLWVSAMITLSGAPIPLSVDGMPPARTPNAKANRRAAPALAKLKPRTGPSG